MKRLLLFCVVFLSSLYLVAQTPTAMTCAEAASVAAALPSTNGIGTLDDTNSTLAAITGYITNTNGIVSREQQTFYIDDVKGSGAKTVQAYWANLPEEDKVTPLAVGEKVTITGRLFNYNGTIPEIKNAEVTVLEHLVVNYDTTEVSICDAIEIGEALNAGDVSEDYYIVKGVAVTANAYNGTYNKQTFDFKCADNNKLLEAYNVSIAETVAVGDTVEVLGRLTNYNNIKIEFNGGSATILGKAVVDTITCNVMHATTAGMAYERGTQSTAIYVVTGYVCSIATAYSEQYDNISFYMCDDMATSTTYAFEAYRVKGGADVQVGDKVAVTGYIQHYYKAATETEAEIELIETVAGASLDILSHYTLQVTSSNNLYGSVSGAGVYSEQQPCVITATPHMGYYFTQWSDGNTDNPRTLTLTSDTSFVAEFAPLIKVSTGNTSPLNTSALWPIVMDENTYNMLSPYVVADFRPNEIDRHFYIWSVEDTYRKNRPVDLNFFGKAEHYLSLTVVAPDGWSGAGFYLDNADAAENLRQAIIAAPNDYYLHLAIKSSDNASHSFALFDGGPGLNFTIGNSSIEGPTIGNFARDGQWHEFDIPMIWFADVLSSHTIFSGTNILYFLSGNSVGAQLDLDAIYFYKQNTEDSSLDAEGTVLGCGYYRQGENVILTAVPNAHYHFTQWSDGNTYNPRTITATQDTLLVAEFAKNSYEITTSAATVGGTTKGDTIALYEERVTITATADYGYYFYAWQDGNSTNPRTITVSENKAYSATFRKRNFSISVATNNSTMGTVSDSGSTPYQETRTIYATGRFGYEFTHWNDGNTENPRSVFIESDSSFVAYFRLQKNGECGANLTWRYAEGSLYISGTGAMSNFSSTTMPWLLLRDSIETVSIDNGVTSIGNCAFYGCQNRAFRTLTLPQSIVSIGSYAFANCNRLTSINFNNDLEEVGDYAFSGCTRINDMTIYATITPDAYNHTFDGVNTMAYLYVLPGSVRTYKLDPIWGVFDIQSIAAEGTTTPVEDMVVEPSDNEASFTWPTETNAATYSLQITKDGDVFCVLTFNANGQLTGIAFAPGRDGANHAPAAEFTTNGGMTFTVTGLNSATAYAFTFNAKDAAQNVIASYQGNFATTGYVEQNPDTPTSVDHLQHDGVQIQKILRDGVLYILTPDGTFDATGRRVEE